MNKYTILSCLLVGLKDAIAGITYLNAAVERIRDCPQANTQQLGDRIGVIFEA
jgi:hypothetical protein